MALAIWLWKSSIETKIDALIAGRNILAFPQAKAIVEVYLAWTRVELRTGIAQFFERDFRNTEAETLNAASEEFIYRSAMEIIKSARAKLQSFALIDGTNVERFLEIHSPLDDGIIGDAKTEVLAEIKRAIVEPASKESAKMASFKILTKASSNTSERLIRILENLYRQPIAREY